MTQVKKKSKPTRKNKFIRLDEDNVKFVEKMAVKENRSQTNCINLIISTFKKTYVV